MTSNKQVVEKVGQIYDWVNQQMKDKPALAGKCKVCGRCCDFETFDHRLFVTTPELMYLVDKIGYYNIMPMLKGRCPWQKENKCSIYEHRFLSCRIFCCKGDKDFQSNLTEETLRKLKSLSTEFDIPYRYTALPAALDSFTIIDEI
jgi:Fe-S-cluster containining protein